MDTGLMRFLAMRQACAHGQPRSHTWPRWSRYQLGKLRGVHRVANLNRFHTFKLNVRTIYSSSHVIHDDTSGTTVHEDALLTLSRMWPVRNDRAYTYLSPGKALS
jgi:hypothetical protein